MTAPNRRPLKSRDTRWARTLASWLVRRNASPNGISIAGMLFATAGAGAFLLGGWLPAGGFFFFPLAAAGIQLRLLCNLLDGLVAVEGGRKERGGDLFNEVPDRYEDFILLFAAGWAAGSPVWGALAAGAAVLTAYARAFGASLGQGQDFSGPLAKPQRMFFLTVGTLGTVLCPPLLGWTVAFIALGAFVTAGARIARLYHRLP